MKSVKVTISSTAGQGKSTVAFIIQKALIDAGIDFKWEEDDIELKEMSLGFMVRTSKAIHEDKIRDYGIKVNLATKQLNRSCIKDDA